MRVGEAVSRLVNLAVTGPRQRGAEQIEAAQTFAVGGMLVCRGQPDAPTTSATWDDRPHGLPLRNDFRLGTMKRVSVGHH